MQISEKESLEISEKERTLSKAMTHPYFFIKLRINAVIEKLLKGETCEVEDIEEKTKTIEDKELRARINTLIQTANESMREISDDGEEYELKGLLKIINEELKFMRDIFKKELQQES